MGSDGGVPDGGLGGGLVAAVVGLRVCAGSLGRASVVIRSSASWRGTVNSRAPASSPGNGPLIAGRRAVLTHLDACRGGPVAEQDRADPVGVPGREEALHPGGRGAGSGCGRDQHDGGLDRVVRPGKGAR